MPVNNSRRWYEPKPPRFPPLRLVRRLPIEPRHGIRRRRQASANPSQRRKSPTAGGEVGYPPDSRSRRRQCAPGRIIARVCSIGAARNMPASPVMAHSAPSAHRPATAVAPDAAARKRPSRPGTCARHPQFHRKIAFAAKVLDCATTLCHIAFERSPKWQRNQIVMVNPGSNPGPPAKFPLNSLTKTVMLSGSPPSPSPRPAVPR